MENENELLDAQCRSLVAADDAAVLVRRAQRTARKYIDKTPTVSDMVFVSFQFDKAAEAMLESEKSEIIYKKLKGIK